MTHAGTASALCGILCLCACTRIPSSIVAERTLRPLPAPRDIPKPSRTFALDLINRRAPGHLELTAFDTGVMHVRGEGVSSLKSWHAKLRLNVPAFLIRHPREGYILFDTGLSTRTPSSEGFLEEIIDPAAVRWSASRGQDLPAQLSAAGIELSQIRWVILSCLRGEHVGTLPFFSSATIAASRVEYEAWSASDVKSRAPEPAEIPAERWRLIALDEKPLFGPFLHSEDLFGDGTLYLADLPGRSPGSLGALVMLDEGPMLLSGGATLVIDNILDLALPYRSQVADRKLFWRSLHMLRALRQCVPQVQIIPGYELSALRMRARQDARENIFSSSPAIPRREKDLRAR